MEENKELSLALDQFLKIIYVDFGIKKVNAKIKKWHELSWEEFKKELENQSVHFNDCILNDWKEFFVNHKTKVHKLLKEESNY